MLLGREQQQRNLYCVCSGILYWEYPTDYHVNSTVTYTININKASTTMVEYRYHTIGVPIKMMEQKLNGGEWTNDIARGVPLELMTWDRGVMFCESADRGRQSPAGLAINYTLHAPVLMNALRMGGTPPSMTQEEGIMGRPFPRGAMVWGVIRCEGSVCAECHVGGCGCEVWVWVLMWVWVWVWVWDWVWKACRCEL